MQGQILRVRDLGQDNFWRVLHEAAPTEPAAAPDATQPSSFIDHSCSLRVLALWGSAGHKAGQTERAEQAETLESRALLHAAVHSLGGSLEHMSLPQEWGTSAHAAALASLAAASAHICVAQHFSPPTLDVLAAACPRPLYNMGNALCRLDAALADLALIQTQGPALDKVRIAWVGGVNGLAHALMEAAIYAPVELFMAVPAWGEPDKDLTALALKAGAKIFLTREPHLALDGAHYVYAGSAGPLEEQNPRELRAGMALTLELLTHAQPAARIMAGTALHGCHSRMEDVPPDTALEQQRLEYRLRVQLSLLRLLAASAQS